MKRTLILSLLGLLLFLTPTSVSSLGATSLGRFKVTAYTGSHQKHTSIPVTRSGKVASAGRTIAVDPKIIPLGSVVEIEGVGRRIAEDTGGKIKGHVLDLYVDSRAAAFNWGVRYAEVSLVDPAVD